MERCGSLDAGANFGGEFERIRGAAIDAFMGDKG